jgi:hypothetical protein
MRAYLPVAWADLAALQDTGALPGPRPAVVVAPAWRAGAPDVDEEEWEFEAQSAAAAGLPPGGGVVLAVDLDAQPGAVPDDGRTQVPGPVRRADVAAVLTADLAWYGVQEIPELLAGR